MAKSVQERCDNVIGSGSTFLAAGSYKEGEETRYKFGFALDLPSKADMGELANKIYNVGLHRVMSVKAAGIFNEKNEYGSQEQAEAFHKMFSTVEGWTEAFEKARREPSEKVDTFETKISKYLQDILRDKVTANALPEGLPEAPLTEKGKINYPAWAKKFKEAEHPWWAVAEKKVKAIEEAKKKTAEKDFA